MSALSTIRQIAADYDSVHGTGRARRDAFLITLYAIGLFTSCALAAAIGGQ